MDAANIDLKAFSEGFYKRLCTGSLGAVLDTLCFVKHETDTWLEITTLLIPGENDSVEEIGQLCDWMADKLGPDVPLHFTAFHPDYKMLDTPPTPPQTLSRAREIALANGVRHAYTGNVFDADGGSTYCHACGERVIERDWYRLGEYRVSNDGRCASCSTQLPGVFVGDAGSWGRRRLPVRLAQ